MLRGRGVLLVLSVLTQLASGEKTNFLFLGNPGAGKSTLLNALAGKPIFEAGVSVGGGLTTLGQTETVGDIIFYDTPGLADAELRENASKAITEALNAGGRYKIVFIILTTQGRIRTDDQATMKLVLDSVPDIEANQYGVIINQCNKGVMQKIKVSAMDTIKKFQTILFSQLDRATMHMEFLELVPELDGADNALLPDPSKLKKFMEGLPGIDLKPGHAKAIQHDIFDAQNKQIEALMKQVEAEKETYKKMSDEKDKKLEAMVQKMSQTGGKPSGILGQILGEVIDVGASILKEFVGAATGLKTEL